MAYLVLAGGELDRPDTIPVLVGARLIGDVYRVFSEAHGWWWWAWPSDVPKDEGVPLGPFDDFSEAVEALAAARIRRW